MDFCTLQDVRVELLKAGSSGVDDNAMGARVARVTALINSHCNHWLDDRTIVNEVRRGEQVAVSAFGDLVVSASTGNIRTMTGVSWSRDLLTWTALDLTKIGLDVDGYVVTCLDSNLVSRSPGGGRGRAPFVRLSYVGGYNPVPLDLVQAAARWVAWLFIGREAEFHATGAGARAPVAGAVPADVVDALNVYLRRRP